MSGEFVDTNVLIYAYDQAVRRKYDLAIELVARLDRHQRGSISIQVLTEFYWGAIKKLRLPPADVEEILCSFERWKIHCPSHADLIRASKLLRRYQISWWDALIVNSALELECSTLWTEDLQDGQKIESL